MNSSITDTKRHLAAYKNLHAADTIIVCGCGHSLKGFFPPKGVYTIGVNDVGRLFTPDYLVVLNSPTQFKYDRFQYIKNSQAKALFTQLKLGIPHQNVVHFKLGHRGAAEIRDDFAVPYTRNSPYVALCLAMFMGAKKIGLIGVDFTDHHFFSNTGKHVLNKSLPKINQEYEQLQKIAIAKGIHVANLSTESRLDAFRKESLSEFLHMRSPGNISQKRQHKELDKGSTMDSLKPLKIVSYSTTPVAGVPELLARCINQQTIHHCECVWQNNTYANGVRFSSALEWSRKPNEAKKALTQADVVIVHNGKVAREHKALLAHKAVVTMAHNYLWNVDQQFIAHGMPGVVVGQYQATLPEFSAWTPVANPVPEWDEFHRPRNKNSLLTICYTPSGKHERYPRDHRLYWHSKGYATTMAILERLAKRFPLKLNVIRDKQLNHQQVLRMKQESHIVIDECVTGSYHRNSLEGLACGCVVINGMDENVRKILTSCAGGDVTDAPFVSCKLDMLEKTLIELIKLGKEELTSRGHQNRLWLEQHWSFDRQWQTQWQPVIQKALNRAIEGKSPSGMQATGFPSERKSTSLASNPKKLSKNTNSECNPLSVYWTCRNAKRGNFGDMLSPILVKAMSGRPVAFKQNAPRLFAVGSLLKFAKAGDLVWGAGFIHENDRAQKGIDVRAVRGPLTRDILLSQGIACPEVFGDPGLLLPAIFDKPVKTKYEIGLIPHYADLPNLRKILSRHNKQSVRIIDIRAGVDEVIKMTRQCEIVLSSSLHGIILAEAYGIPAAWVDISDKVVGDGFKFRDYYASTDRQALRLDWRQTQDLQAGIETALTIPSPKIDLHKLIESFPFLQGNHFSGFTLPYKRPIRNHQDNLNPTQMFTGDEARNKTAELHQPTTNSTPKGAGQMPSPTKANKRLCIYGTATENYVEFLVASLRSFMKHNGHEDIDYYILGNNFTLRTQRLMHRLGIRYHNINLNETFSRNLRYRYPSECFWIFKGPELFYSMGYPYSLAIDGDILCRRKLDLDWLTDLEHIAGIHRGCTTAEFLKNINQLTSLKQKLNLDESHASRPATNSGVLFFNNGNLASAEFFKRAVNIFRSSEKAGIPRAGDDSTLALILALNPDLKLRILPDGWNVYRGLTGPSINEGILSTAKIIHLSAMKPWLHHKKWPNNSIKQMVDEWRKCWPSSKIQRSISANMERDRKTESRKVTGIHHARKSSSPLPVDLYWYRGSVMNIGDEIAPYLVSKILDLCPTSIPTTPVAEPCKSPRDVLISVGSVLRLSGKNTLVWGAGIRNIDQDVAAAKRFYAVRGPITYRRLKQLGYECADIFGDPAILLPRYYQPRAVKRYQLGIVPHLMDYSNIKNRLPESKAILLVDVRTNNIENIIEQLASCETLVSSSLHGIILAVAYGIPVRWLKVSDRIMGDDCKFYDFFSSLDHALLDDFDFDKVAITNPTKWRKYTPLELKGRLDLPRISKEVFPIANTLDSSRLLSAFPFELFSNLDLSA